MIFSAPNSSKGKSTNGAQPPGQMQAYRLVTDRLYSSAPQRMGNRAAT
nr:hypothetical protein [Curtanaerobium respiraculi]